MEKLGLVGLANAGKSTLYNALTGSSTLVASHPFSTTDTTVGDAVVPDERLEKLARLHESKKKVYAHIQIADIAGLVAGSSTGAGLGNRFLAQIREVDGIVYVLRGFVDDGVPGDPDPLSNLETLELELTLADLATVEANLDRRRRVARSDKSLAPEIAALEEAHAVLAEGVPLYRSGLSGDVVALLHNAFLLTDKTVMAVINVSEDNPAGDSALEDKIASQLGTGATVVSASVKLEAELLALGQEERAEMMEELGVSSSALVKVASAAYRALGRYTFFTTGDKETHAWTFRAGSNAVVCAGVIHSDLARGFIRAEIVGWDELLDIGSWSKAKSLGRLRIEGKDYLVRDGDVLEIRFNV
ncbi:MAG: redox-regulated ATPase YchF [Ferrimicrobium sp.]